MADPLGSQLSVPGLLNAKIPEDCCEKRLVDRQRVNSWPQYSLSEDVPTWYCNIEGVSAKG